MTAYLNAEIPEGTDYFVEQPHGLVKDHKKVWKVEKALYGFRKSPLYWYNTVTLVLRQIGFMPVTTELYLFRNKQTDAYLILYINDLQIAAITIKAITSTRDRLRKHFKLKDLSEAKHFLGLDVVRDREKRTVFITQQKYTKILVDSYREDLNPVKTLWPANFVLPRT